MRKKSSPPEVILGIDPGFGLIGWAVIKKDREIVDYGSIKTEGKGRIENRLVEIGRDLEEIITTYHPQVLAIEKLFYFKNAKTVIDVAQSRGVTIYLARQAGLQVAEYTPLEIKLALTGYGRADKRQIQRMVVSLFKLSAVPKPDDVADALAVAYTHLVYSANRSLVS